MAKDNEEQTSDTDETVEQEESTDNQDEGSENEETSEEQSEEESDSSPEDSGDFGKSLNLGALPPELRVTGKKILSQYTKATQKLKEEYNKLNEGLGEKYAAQIIKAKALDNLGGNEDFKLFVQDITSGRGYGYSSKFRNGKSGSNDDDDDTEQDGKDSGKLSKADIQRLIDSSVRNITKPIFEEKSQADLAWAKKNLRDFSKYQADITDALSRFPKMTLVEAYNFVSRDDAIALAKNGSSKKDEDDVERLRKKPRAEKGSSGRSDTLTPTDIKTLRGAVEYAAKQQRQGASKT